MPEFTYAALERLLDFAIAKGLLLPLERRWARNLLMAALQYDAPPENAAWEKDPEMPETATGYLSVLLDDVAGRGIIEDTGTRRELFSARLMGLLTPNPGQVLERFEALRASEGIRAATDWFYALCRANDYIRVDAIARNARFFAPSPYGDLEITINLSKPEKDPRDIAALLTQKAVSYPKCMLCTENEGYAGRLDFPARQNLRLVPLALDGEPYYFQYSPYLYYPEHAIILNERHIPMSIGRDTFARLLSFLTQFPHYFIGSNADLPIVGGSILNHDHFQGGRYTFPMQQAPCYAQVLHPAYPQVQGVLVSWPLPTLRLTGHDPEALVTLADAVLSAWRGYSDPELDVLAFTGDTPHNTITPIARREGKGYSLDLVLRNNRTTEEFPLGLFHPHPELHHIKKENIGLIEVMGLFILPGRLKDELSELSPFLTGARRPEDVSPEDPLAQHMPWISSLREQHDRAESPEAADALLREALSERCARVLYDAGVFKLDDAGKAGMRRFVESAGFQIL